MKKNHPSFLITGLSMVFIVACLFFLFLNNHTQTRIFWENQLDKLALTTERCRVEASGWVSDYVRIMYNLSNEITSGHLHDKSSFVDFFTRVQKRNEAMTSVYCWKEGNIAYYNEGMRAVSDNQIYEDNYRLAIEADGDVVFSDAHMDTATNSVVVSCLRLVKTDAEEQIVVGFDVSVNRLIELAAELRPSENGGAWIATKEMKVLTYSSDPSFEPKIINGEVSFVDAEDILAQVKIKQTINKYSDKGISMEYIEDYDGKLKYEAVTTVPITNWVLGVNVPITDYSNELGNAVRDQLPILIIALSLSVISIVYTYVMIFNSKNQQNNLVIALEAAEQATAAKSDFLATISHEIRTPMNAIIGMSDVLLNERLTTRQQKYVYDIKHSSNALLVLINEILDFSKIESGKFQLAPVNYLFDQMVSDIESIVESIIKDKPIRYELYMEGSVPECLFGDDLRIRQILINLMSNAVKFTDSGYVKLKIQAEDDIIRFIVSDTGRGIQEKDIARLFNTFTRIDEKQNRSIGGTGLGLSISKALAELMGGDITVKSEYGKGSEFTLALPLVKGEAVDIKQVEGHVEFIYAPKAKVLVVDDIMVNLNVAAGLLRLCGIEAHLVDSGAKALELVKEKDFDLIMMDHMMPEMDGIECTHHIRDIGGTRSMVPIIALTANAVAGSEMYIREGMNDFIAKPINTNILNAMLLKYIPKEKIEKRVNEDVYAIKDSEREILRRVKELNEIDVKLGLSRVMERAGTYIQNLDIFVRNTERFITAVNRMIAENDIEAFAITVHGIKGTLVNIGAMDVSQLAAELEAAAKNGDLEFCKANIIPLNEQLLSIRDRLAEILSDKEKERSKESGDAAALKEKLAKAAVMLDDFMVDEASGLLAELITRTYGKEIDNKLSDASNYIKDYQYDLAADEIKQIIPRL